MKTTLKKASLAVGFACLSAGIATQVNAAGFALIENSASGMGNAFAGAAAAAQDASTVFFNPAGMNQLSGSQIVVAGHYISLKADFTNDGSTLATTAPLTGEDDDGGTSSFVPNFYYVTELSDKTRFGVGVNVPFGLSTDYNDEWIGRYHATTSEISSININPSFSAQMTDSVDVGFGLNVQFLKAQLDSQVDTGMVCIGLQLQGGASDQQAVMNCAAANLPAGDASLDSSAELSADSMAIGWNLGFMIDIDDSSRVGVAYRSAIRHKLKGEADFTRSAALDGFLSLLTPPADVLNSAFQIGEKLKANVELPAMLSVSYANDIDDKLTLLADITLTQWGKLDEVYIDYYNNPYQSDTTLVLNWEDSWRYSFGASYKADDTITYRAGVALDQTPIPDEQSRTARIPGNDRTWLSLGMGYNLDSATTIDVGYSHLFIGNTDINNTDTSFGHTLKGSYDGSVDILSVQGTFKF